MKLKVEYLPVASLAGYHRNSRTHSPEQIRAIADSIREFGFNDPIGVRGGVIAEGHGRLEAARLLGMDKVPVLRLDHLTEAQFRAYVIAHNSLQELGGWDKALLADELQELTDLDIDMGLLGFDDADMDQLLNEYHGDPDEATMDANAAGAPEDANEPGEAMAPGERKAPPIRVPILIELSKAEHDRWREIKKALGTQDNAAAFKHVAGIQEIAS